jgi:hypothetical protein
MNEHCPVCGLVFQREPGYFMGAMYISYALGVPLIATLTCLTWLLFRDWPIWGLVLVAWLAFLPLVPSVFRWSRVLWIHLDHKHDDEGQET